MFLILSHFDDYFLVGAGLGKGNALTLYELQHLVLEGADEFFQEMVIIGLIFASGEAAVDRHFCQ